MIELGVNEISKEDEVVLLATLFDVMGPLPSQITTEGILGNKQAPTEEYMIDPHMIV